MATANPTDRILNSIKQLLKALTNRYDPVKLASKLSEIPPEKLREIQSILLPAITQSEARVEKEKADKELAERTTLNDRAVLMNTIEQLEGYKIAKMNGTVSTVDEYLAILNPQQKKKPQSKRVSTKRSKVMAEVDGAQQFTSTSLDQTRTDLQHSHDTGAQ